MLLDVDAQAFFLRLISTLKLIALHPIFVFIFDIRLALLHWMLKLFAVYVLDLD